MKQSLAPDFFYLYILDFITLMQSGHDLLVLDRAENLFPTSKVKGETSGSNLMKEIKFIISCLFFDILLTFTNCNSGH